MKNNKNIGKYYMGAVFCLLFMILIILVRSTDVAAIGPAGTSVGLSHINRTVSDLFGVNWVWYDVTSRLGIAVILTGLAFAAAGLVQMIRRKNIRKVDKEILALGGLYIITAGLYLFFEKVIINYRPVIMPGCEYPEASFPSSHTMLACVIMGSIAIVMRKYVKDERLCNLLRIICCLMIAVIVVGRLISGVHWFTDILGGVLISAALLSVFTGILGQQR